MNKTKIEWVKNPDGTQGYTWNPITGCLNGCEYCYARKLANGRLRSLYLSNTTVPVRSDLTASQMRNLYCRNPFYPRFWPERVYDSYGLLQHLGDKPKGIFVCDMSDLFGFGIPEDWTRQVLYFIWVNPNHRFYLLTKQPQNLIQFSPFPDNCWVGVTATDSMMAWNGYAGLKDITSSIKFLSLEPLLGDIDIRMLSNFKGTINWLIIGACTGKKGEILELCKKYPDLTPMPYGKIWTAQPKIEWVREIVEAADSAGIPVFLKDNLMPLFEAEGITEREDWTGIRQEMPK